MTDYYDVLGVEEGASEKGIESARAEQIQRWHPDKCDHPRATELMKDINQASDGLFNGKSEPGSTGQQSDRALSHRWENGYPIEPKKGDESEASTTTGASTGETTDSGNSGRRNSDEANKASSTNRGSQSYETGTDNAGGKRTTTSNSSGQESRHSAHGDPTSSASSSTTTQTDTNWSGHTDFEDIEWDSSIISRRSLLYLGLGTLGIVGGQRVLSSFSDNETGSPEVVEVQQGESIQNAIDSVQDGGTVQVDAGVYEEGVSIAKSVELITTEDAVLDGSDATSESGIVVQTDGVSIDGFEIGQFSSNGVDTDEHIEGQISIANCTIVDNESAGINCSANDINVETSTVTNNGPAQAGILLHSAREGTVSITETTVENTVRHSVNFEGRGISIRDGEDISLRNVELIQNSGWNLRIEADEARGQSIDVRNSRIVGNDVGAGVSIAGTSGEDSVTIENVESIDHEAGGMDISADNIQVSDSTLSSNGPAQAGLEIKSSRDGEVVIEDTTVEDTARIRERKEGRGISVSEGTTVMLRGVELTQNGGWNLRIAGDEARNRTIEVVDTVAEGNNVGDGISIPGDGDSIMIEAVESIGHDAYGFSLGGEDITIRDSTATSNSEGPIEFLDIDRDQAMIINSDL